MAEAKSERTYSDEEIQQRLKRDLPHWYLENGWIRRKYRTNSWKGTLMVINTVGHLAEAAWHHPDITASYAWVEVRLKITPPKASPTKTSSWRKRLRTSFIGNRGRRAARSKARRRRISASPTSNTTADRQAAVVCIRWEPGEWSTMHHS